MRKICFFLMVCLFVTNLIADEGGKKEMDRISLNGETFDIHFYGHSSLMIQYKSLCVYTDPVSQYADYAALPKADIILITHEHFDHLDKEAVSSLLKKDTKIVTNPNSAKKLGRGDVLKNGQTITEKGIKIEAVPAYNATKGHEQYHPKGRDNGYILNLGAVRIYIAGDTEDIPEMTRLKNIDIAFLPVNQPYTMTPAQLRHAVEIIRPKIVYPYHFSETDPQAMKNALKDVDGVELRIRNME